MLAMALCDIDVVLLFPHETALRVRIVGVIVCIHCGIVGNHEPSQALAPSFA